MWKALWQRWTIDKPAKLGDWLFDRFVVQLAAFLDRLTLRQAATIIAAVILVLTYAHGIPVSPALIFVGDLLAYLDLFAILFLLGILSRVDTAWLILRQVAAWVATRADRLVATARRLDFRHRHASGTKGRRRPTGGSKSNDDEPAIAGGLAWA